MSDPDMKKNSKKVINYVKKVQKDIKKINISDQKRYEKNFDSLKYLNDSKEYLEKTFKCKVEIFKNDNDEIYDPEGKSNFAMPLRPAIYMI